MTTALTIQKKELKLKTRQIEHGEYLDRVNLFLSSIDRIMPILTNPAVMFIGAYLAVDLLSANEKMPLGTADAVALKTALIGAFTANAFGGPAGISQIISAIR